MIFGNFITKANLSKNDLAVYYKKLSDLLDEFNTDIPEIEFHTDTASPSSELLASCSTAGSDGLSGRSESPMTPMYSDPAVQKKFEQFCMTQYGKKLKIKKPEETFADGKLNGQLVQNTPRQVVTHKSMVAGDGKTPAIQETIDQNDGNSVGLANPTQQTTDTLPAKPKPPTAFTVSLEDTPIGSANPTRQSTDILAAKSKPATAFTVSLEEASIGPANPTRQAADTLPAKPKPATAFTVSLEETPIGKSKPSSVCTNLGPANPTRQSTDTLPAKPKPATAFTVSLEETPIGMTEPLSDSTNLGLANPTRQIADTLPAKPKPATAFTVSLEETPIGMTDSLSDSTNSEPANPTRQFTDVLPAKPKLATAFTISFDDPVAVKPGQLKETSSLESKFGPANPTKQTTKKASQALDEPSVIPALGPANLPRHPRDSAAPEDLDISTVPVFNSPSRQRVLHTPVEIKPWVRAVNTEPEEVPPSPAKQPVSSIPARSPVIPALAAMPDPVPSPPPRKPGFSANTGAKKIEVDPDRMEVPVFNSPSKQRVLHTPVMVKPQEAPEASEVQPPAYSPVPRLQLPVSPDEEGLFPAPVGTCCSSSSAGSLTSPTKPTSRMVGKIGTGLLTRNKATPKVPGLKKVLPAKKPADQNVTDICNMAESEEKPEAAKEKKVPKKGAVVKKPAADKVNENKDKKKGLLKRCVDKIRPKSSASKHKIIKVKPASPECAIKNVEKKSAVAKKSPVFNENKPIVVADKRLISHRPKQIPPAKKVVPQPNLKPDKGIVWPKEFEGLNIHNKSYYVEQFMRSELFKQRCGRKKKGSTVWMNGLSNFQLWVIEHEGTDAIDAVLNPLPKTVTDAKAKVKCWRGDTPEC